MTRLEDAIAHLSAALVQSIPSDDQIIMGHVRDALALLREHRAAERAYDADAERRHAEHEQRYDAWRDSLADRGSP